MKVKMKLVGTKEYTNILKTLPTKVSDSILRSFNRQAANKNVVKPLKSSLPYSENIKKNIKVQASNKNKTAVVAGPTSEVFYVRFLDQGTKNRTTKSGANRGQIIGKFALEPAIDGRVNSIIKYTNKEYGKEINKFLKRKIKRLKK